MPTLFDKFEGWMINHHQLSANSARHYRRRIRQAYEELVFDPVEHSDKEVEQFVIDRGGSPSNHDSWVGALRHYQEFCIDQIGMDAHFADRLQLQRRPVRLPRPVEFGALYKMLATIPLDTFKGRRDRAICELLYCGLRNEEVCNTNLTDYHDCEVRVIGKGNKERLVPINDVAWEYIIRYAIEVHGGVTPATEPQELMTQFAIVQGIRGDVPMFLSITGISGVGGNRRIDTGVVRTLVDDAEKGAGLTMNVTPHMLRHSFVTHSVEAGATDIFAMKEVLGHSDISTVQHYWGVARKGRFTRVRRFHPRQMGLSPETMRENP